VDAINAETCEEDKKRKSYLNPSHRQKKSNYCEGKTWVVDVEENDEMP